MLRKATNHVLTQTTVAFRSLRSLRVRPGRTRGGRTSRIGITKISVALLFFVVACPIITWGQSSWDNMSREERKALQKRYREWERLPESEKAIVEENYRRWKGLPKYEKQELKKRWQFWQGLPKDRRDNLKQQFRQQFHGGQRRNRNR